jgi:hypothetical protein
MKMAELREEEFLHSDQEDEIIWINIYISLEAYYLGGARNRTTKA